MTTFLQLQSVYRQRVDSALERYLSELPEPQSPLVEAMRYGALLGKASASVFGLRHGKDAGAVYRNAGRPGSSH